MSRSAIIAGVIAVAALPAYELIGIWASGARVRELCTAKPPLQVFDTRTWTQWSRLTRGSGLQDTELLRPNLAIRAMADSRGLWMLEEKGYELSYPWSGVFVSRATILQKRQAIARLSYYSAQTEMGPMQRALFGGQIGGLIDCHSYVKYPDGLYTYEFGVHARSVSNLKLGEGR